MSKFTEDAKLLLEYIEGKDNIKAVTHCVICTQNIGHIN